MRFAIFTDIHANLPALKVLLEKFNNLEVDEIIHLGDTVGIGPYPDECIELMNRRNVTNIMGNHDQLIARGLPERKPHWMSSGEYEHQTWVQKAVSDSSRSIVKKYPYSIGKSYFGNSFLFLHYGFSNDAKNDFLPIIKEPLSSDLDKIFYPNNSDFIFYGHHHPFSDLVGHSRYVNPGSAGCYSKPLARYTILNVHENCIEIDHSSVEYNDSDLFNQMALRQVPEKEFIEKVFFPR